MSDLLARLFNKPKTEAELIQSVNKTLKNLA